MDMVAIDQNMLYIIIAVLVIVIILLIVFMRRRGSKEGPKNVNQYLSREAKHKKVQIVEREEGFETKIPLYLRRQQDELNDIREAFFDLEHKNIYHNSKVQDKVECLESREEQINLEKQLKNILKKNLELNSKIKPKKGK